MIGVDIGDDGDHRLQVQEGGIALVSFSNQIAAFTQLGIGAGGGQLAANHEGWAQTVSREYRGDQTGSRGFAMGTGDGNAMTIAHQLGQHLGARHHRNAAFDGARHFRVLRIDRAGHHQHVGFLDILGAMADINTGAKGFQALGHRRAFQVRARYLIAQVEQHFGNTAHAHTADTDKVNMADAPHLRQRKGCLTALVSAHGLPPDRRAPHRQSRSGWLVHGLVRPSVAAAPSCSCS